jgi:hypothetical protein
MPVAKSLFIIFTIVTKGAARKGYCNPCHELQLRQVDATNPKDLNFYGSFEQITQCVTLTYLYGGQVVLDMSKQSDWPKRLSTALIEAGMTAAEHAHYQELQIPQYFEVSLLRPYQRARLDPAAYIATAEAVVNRCLERMGSCVALHNHDGVVVQEPTAPPEPPLILTAEHAANSAGWMDKAVTMFRTSAGA